MKTEKRLLGDLGEDAAVKYLRKNHYKIVARNYTCGKNEIDIIAENREYIAFVEVKTRTYKPENIDRYGRACEAVDREKRRCLLAGARGYCTEKPPKKKVRLDVVEVYFDNSTPPRLLSIHHMPDAFRAE